MPVGYLSIARGNDVEGGLTLTGFGCLCPWGGDGLEMVTSLDFEHALVILFDRCYCTLNQGWDGDVKVLRVSKGSIPTGIRTLQKHEVNLNPRLFSSVLR